MVRKNTDIERKLNTKYLTYINWIEHSYAGPCIHPFGIKFPTYKRHKEIRV